MPVGKIGDYSIGRNGTEASPDRLAGLDDTSYGLKERLKLSKLRTQNQDVSDFSIDSH